MCLQCNVASTSFGEVLPGWYLHQATKEADYDKEDWPKDWWGLVECNDPTFVFETTPELDPVFGLNFDFKKSTKEEIDKLSHWSSKAHEFQHELVLDPESGHRLIEAAKQAGWIRKDHPNFAEWLFHRMARIIRGQVVA